MTGNVGVIAAAQTSKPYSRLRGESLDGVAREPGIPAIVIAQSAAILIIGSADQDCAPAQQRKRCL